MKEKTCTRCEETKPATAEYFPRNARYSDGLFVQCKACIAQKTREWRKRNREHTLEYGRKWRKANPDKVKSYKRNRYAELTAANKRLTEEIETKNMHIGAISALLPSAEVQRALLKMTIIVDQTSTGELEIDPRKVVKSNLLEEIKLCYAWLDRLESEAADDR